MASIFPGKFTDEGVGEDDNVLSPFAEGGHVNSQNIEPEVEIFAEFAGTAGPQFAATSCVACHVNNGRSLPPAVGSPFTQAAIYLGADVDGTPHPTLGEVLQPYPSGNAGGGDPTTIEAEAFNA